MLSISRLLARCEDLAVEGLDAIGDSHHDTDVTHLCLEEPVACLVAEPVAVAADATLR
jgi:hypothetical protein